MNKNKDVVLIRREYNQWVENETLEDYALRFSARQSRRWSPAWVENTALGIVSFLALEAIGGAITLDYGFSNAMWAILVVVGITRISRFQAWTQPIWLVIQILPLAYIAVHESNTFSEWLKTAGQETPNNQGFNLLLFGAAAAIIFPIIVQNGEQADFLRFLPPVNRKNKIQWWLAVVGAGPGWFMFGIITLLSVVADRVINTPRDSAPGELNSDAAIKI